MPLALRMASINLAVVGPQIPLWIRAICATVAMLCLVAGNFVCPHGPQEVAAFSVIIAAKEHQYSPGFDGEDTIMWDDVEYEYDSCKTLENICVHLVKTTCIGARCPLEHKCVP